MARPLRVEYEGAVYHILARGNRAEFIFEEDKDKEYFLQILERVVEKYGIELYAYCVMGNHYHLLLGTPYGTLSKVMHTVQSSYGSYQQREGGWIGHVFAGRYKSGDESVGCRSSERYVQHQGLTPIPPCVRSCRSAF